jgi:hypothetical protein
LAPLTLGIAVSVLVNGFGNIGDGWFSGGAGQTRTRKTQEGAVINFVVILRIVLLFTVTCGILAVVVAIVSAVIPMPLAGQLVVAFTDTFKLGVAAIVGLIGGRGDHSRTRQ